MCYLLEPSVVLCLFARYRAINNDSHNHAHIHTVLLSAFKYITTARLFNDLCLTVITKVW